jgi:hypothetical protein
VPGTRETEQYLRLRSAWSPSDVLRLVAPH